MVCDVCKEADAVVQLTQIEGTGVRLLHLVTDIERLTAAGTTISALRKRPS